MPHFLEDRVSTEPGLLLHHGFVHSPSFVYLVKYIYTSQQGLRYLFYTLYYYPKLFSLLCCTTLAIRHFFTWLPGPLTCTQTAGCSCCLSISLFSGPARCSRLISYISGPRSYLFLQEALVPLLENGLRNQADNQ